MLIEVGELAAQHGSLIRTLSDLGFEPALKVQGIFKRYNMGAVSDEDMVSAFQQWEVTTLPTRFVMAGSRSVGNATRAVSIINRKMSLLWAYQYSGSRGNPVKLLVGDCYGVDQVVVNAADRYKIETEVYGITEKPRIRLNGSAKYHKVEKTSYTERDRFMIGQAHMGLFFWNGHSPGTKAGFDYANSIGIHAVMVTL